MNWGKELWDQFDLLAAHTNNGIEFVEKVSKFVKERSRIEVDYAKELRKLAKSYQPKKKEEDDQKCTFQKAFSGIVNETDDLAGQHELISENLNVNVYKELQNLHQELKHERKKNLIEGRKVQDALEHSKRVLETSKKLYEKASSEAEQALAAFQKADQDMSMTKLQIEKFKGTSIEKGQVAEKAKDEYRSQLDKTNNKQTLHYNTQMPAVFNDLQTMEEKRISRVGELLTEYADIECKVMPVVQTCLDNMKKIAASVDGSKDSVLVIEQNRSALQPPGNIQFEEYGKTQTIARPGQAATTERKKRDKTGKKSFWKTKKVEGDGNDFQTLPPGQKIRVCKKKVSEFETQFAQLKASREAMEKMVGVYHQNPSLGDVASVEQQLGENAKELDSIGSELFKYKSYLALLEHREAPDEPARYSKSSSVHPPPAPSDNFPPAPPSLLVPPVEEGDVDDNEFDDDVHCKVLYDFQGTNDGELPVQEGEELVVLEIDNDGSGWTKVLNGDNEGYVPTAYVQILD